MSEENNTGARKKEYDTTTSVESEESEQGKRQRTTSLGQGNYGTSGEIPASPPKFISLEELMRAANGVTNMVLAHEIAVNKDFKLEKFEAPQNSLEKKVEDVVHRAFWDVLKTELSEDPPNYTQAMVLLGEIKNGLLELLLPQHTKIRQQISEVLDVELIKQQANAGTLDFQQYAQYVISVMGKLCAPVRDEKIASLTKTTDVVEVFKGILETIDLMKLDMANFTINVMRPQIVANSIQYEKKKFADFLKLDQDCLILTKKWLRNHLSAAEQYAEKSKKITAVINSAYLELLEWNETQEFPETAIMDKGRILDLKKEHEKLILIGAVLLLAFAQSGPDLCSIQDFKNKLKDDILTLLNADNQERHDLKVVLEEISEKLKHDIVKAVDQYDVGRNQINVGNLALKLGELTDKNHKIKCLLHQRIREFLLDTVTSQTAEPMKIPPGFSSLQQEVTQLAGNFLRLTSHNRAVYEEYYTKIIEESLP
ncbi:conserved hypothetical protein [Pediculus humanus corporis]|uniref:T-complex protein 11-like protein 1 n=1 Tax=Pediculus humanus subsp. corporis TaxID=121224 RepID=E0VBB1_PEDHC|nr:uncharacterized protein Phum_PHUM055930 [Pediculus humanus corporis]EEB10667.1 conserved hypothetical protein [Pediculus humanus corporis]